MRPVTSFVNVLVLLGVAAGMPQAHTLGAGVHVGVPSSIRDAAFVSAPTPDSGPAPSRATEDGARIEVATVWKSVQSDIAILPNGLVLPSLGPTAPSGRQIAPFRSSAASSWCVVRGPPVAL